MVKIIGANLLERRRYATKYFSINEVNITPYMTMHPTRPTVQTPHAPPPPPKLTSPVNAAHTDVAIGVGLAVKVFVTAFIVWSFYQLSDFANVPNLWNRHYSGQGNLTAWYLPFANWDGQHYLRLSEWHWAQSQNSWAFSPLYPFLIYLLAVVMPPYVAALLLNFALTCGFLIYLCKLAAHFDAKSPLLVVLLTMSFPTMFFGAAIYTESLLLFLQIGFIYHALVDRKPLGWLWLFLLPLTRGTAMFIFGGFVLYAAQQYWAHIKNRAVADSKHLTRKQRKRLRHHSPPSVELHPRYALGCITAFALGVCAYLLFFTVATGHPLSGIDAQLQTQFTAQNSIINLVNPMVFIGNLIEPLNGLFKTSYALFDRIILIVCLLCIGVFVAARQWTLLCFYFPLIYAHAAMGAGATSYSRYALLAMPLLAVVLVRCVHKRIWLWIICALLFTVQLWCASFFAQNWWVA